MIAESWSLPPCAFASTVRAGSSDRFCNAEERTPSPDVVRRANAHRGYCQTPKAKHGDSRAIGGLQGRFVRRRKSQKKHSGFLASRFRLLKACNLKLRHLDTSLHQLTQHCKKITQRRIVIAVLSTPGCGRCAHDLRVNENSPLQDTPRHVAGFPRRCTSGQKILNSALTALSGQRLRMWRYHGRHC